MPNKGNSVTIAVVVQIVLLLTAALGGRQLKERGVVVRLAVDSPPGTTVIGHTLHPHYAISTLYDGYGSAHNVGDSITVPLIHAGDVWESNYVGGYTNLYAGSSPWYATPEISLSGVVQSAYSQSPYPQEDVQGTGGSLIPPSYPDTGPGSQTIEVNYNGIEEIEIPQSISVPSNLTGLTVDVRIKPTGSAKVEDVRRNGEIWFKL